MPQRLFLGTIALSGVSRGKKVKAGDPAISPGIRKRPGGRLESESDSSRHLRKYWVKISAPFFASCSSFFATAFVVDRKFSQSFAAEARTASRAWEIDCRDHSS